MGNNVAFNWSAGEQPTDPLDAQPTGWRKFFGIKPKKISDNGLFRGDIPFQIVYEARPVPTVNNPLRYAYDSMALPGTAPVGRATAIRVTPGVFTMPGQLQGNQVWSRQGILVSGMPINSGQMYGQALYNPTVPGGYVNEPASHVMPTRNQVL